MTENYTENWIGIEDAAKHLGVTKDTVRTGSRTRIYQRIKLVSYGNLNSQNWMSGSRAERALLIEMNLPSERTF